MSVNYILLTLYRLIIDLYCIFSNTRGLISGGWLSVFTNYNYFSFYLIYLSLSRSGQEHEHVALPRLKPNQSLVLEDYFYSGQSLPLGLLWAYRIVNDHNLRSSLMPSDNDTLYTSSTLSESNFYKHEARHTGCFAHLSTPGHSCRRTFIALNKLFSPKV